MDNATQAFQSNLRSQVSTYLGFGDFEHARPLIGALLGLMVATKPDLAHTTLMLIDELPNADNETLDFTFRFTLKNS